MNKQIIIITAPSGSGKTSIIKRILESHPEYSFSISACTREPRAGEVRNKDYYFISEREFKIKIEADDFIEWEMVYPGKYYGTLYSELERIWNKGQFPLLDIDVQGAMRIKRKFEEQVLSIFIKTPSLKTLKERLLNRGTETIDSVNERLEKAKEELIYEQNFDYTVVNDNLEEAHKEVSHLIESFILTTKNQN